MKLIDLSITLEDDRSWAPWWARTRVKYQDHRFGAWAAWLIFGVKAKHLQGGLGWANENINMSTHGTTHVDAPWHYAPTCGGKPSKTIDQMPLERFFAPGVRLDLRGLDSDQAATAEDLQQALAAIDHELADGQIVLVQTGNDALLGDAEYFHTGPGVSAAGTRWLIDQGVSVVGIDAWSWDRPLRTQAKEAKASGRDDLFWEAHYVGVDREYCQIERLCNLDQLPPCGFTISAFPLKVKNGSGGPARVVAILD